MSIAAIVTRGYGSFGSIGEIVTAGYAAAEGQGEVIPPEAPATLVVGDGGLNWRDEVQARFERRELERQLRKAKREEQKLVKEEAKIERKIEAEKRQSKPVDGILAKYWQVSLKLDEKRAEIKRLEIQFHDITHFLEDDEEEEEMMLLS